MTDSMRLEIRSQGISVSLIVPGFIKTEIHGKNDASTRNLLATLPKDGLKKYGPAIERLRAGDKVQSAKGAPASEVATAIYRALTDSRPRNRYPVTREAKLLGWIGAFLSDSRREKIFGKQFGL
jgi:short-subunit dehydrogenase